MKSQPPQHSPPPPPPAVETPTGIIAQSPVKKTPDKENKPEHPVKKSFKCEQCDFSSDTKRGLSVHNGKAHIKCEYLTDDCDGSNFCCNCTMERFYRENPELDIPFSHHYP